MEVMRAIQSVVNPNWRDGNGRPSAATVVCEWRRQHPEGKKSQCKAETGLSYPTIRKWWDCPPSAVRFEDGHITVRVTPSQAVSDLLVEALGPGKD